MVCMHNLTLAATWTESNLAPPYPVDVLSGKVTKRRTSKQCLDQKVRSMNTL